jgi:hypothetical protein
LYRGFLILKKPCPRGVDMENVECRDIPFRKLLGMSTF